MISRVAAVLLCLTAAAAPGAVNSPAVELPTLVASASAGPVRLHIFKLCGRSGCRHEAHLQWLAGGRVAHSDQVSELDAISGVTRLEADWGRATPPRFTLRLSLPSGASQVLVIETTAIGEYRVREP